MMHLLSPCESQHASDLFLSGLYGGDLFSRWKDLKVEMQFHTERSYVSWLLQVVHHCMRSHPDEARQYMPQNNRNSDQDFAFGCPVTDSVSQNIFDVKEEPVDSVSQAEQLPEATFEETRLNGSDTSYVSNEVDASEQQLVDSAEGNGMENGDVYEREESDEGHQYPVIAVEGDGNETGLLQESEDRDEVDDLSVAAAENDDTENTTYDQASVTSQQDFKLSGDKYTCTLCEYSSYKRLQVRSHFARVHGERYLTCDYCDFISGDKRSLKLHLIDVHNCASNFQCNLCGKYWSSRVQLVSHKKKCLACEFCHYKTDSTDCLKKHLMFKHNEHSSSNSRISAIKDTHPRRATKFKCKTCERTFFYKRSKEKHVKKCERAYAWD